VTDAEQPSHHGPDGRFRNPWPNAEPHGVGDLFRWMVVERLTTTRPRDPDPAGFPRATPAFAAPRAPADALSVTWVGHSTLLLQVGGLNVLTDPVWSERASPLPRLGPRRLVAPGVPFEALPPIDLVLLSHNHYDHLDDRTVRRLAHAHPAAAWMVPLGLASFVRRRGGREVIELDWWQEARAGAATVTGTPAQHFSARGIGDRARTLWCGWVLAAGGRRVYFAGDTALHPEFGAIASRLGPFDAVLLPIGAYAPRWFMRRVHMNAEEAVRAYRELRGAHAEAPARRTVMVATHWGTFKLTDEPLDEPPERARAAWREQGLAAEDLWILAFGETRWVGGRGA
jgi:N-acyl-phosphatidylethanolamine-hydrolysing phospholipase D